MTQITAVCLTLQDTLANHNKFWHAFTAPRPDGGYRVAVHYGRFGTAGGSQVKDFDAAHEANDFVGRKLVEKQAKGYERQRDTERETSVLAAGEKLLALPEAGPPKTANLLEICETRIGAAAEAVGARKALNTTTVEQYRAAKGAWAELERRFTDLQSTMETISELYEQKVIA